MIWPYIRDLICWYLLLSMVLTVVSIIRMNLLNYRANANYLCRERIGELVQRGQWKQIPLYSFDEIRKNKRLAEVRLSFFPCDSGKKTRYVLICPGGGYAHCCTEKEGFSIAAGVNQLGYSAFVLEYRTGFAAKHYGPMKDLAAAIRYIEAHADEYNVYTDHYALAGFSAGGNLVGIYGTEKYGYAHYGTDQPATIMMGYPWTNINHWMDHPYWNIWKGLIGVWFTERGNLFLLGRHQGREARDSLCVQKWITPDYPPSYIFSGGNDVLTPSSRHADVMAKSLKEHGVKYIYRKYFHLPHGIGLGMHTEAEGWLKEAVEFWQENIQEDISTEGADETAENVAAEV